MEKVTFNSFLEQYSLPISNTLLVILFFLNIIYIQQTEISLLSTLKSSTEIPTPPSIGKNLLIQTPTPVKPDNDPNNGSNDKDDNDGSNDNNDNDGSNDNNDNDGSNDNDKVSSDIKFKILFSVGIALFCILLFISPSNNDKKTNVLHKRYGHFMVVLFPIMLIYMVVIIVFYLLSETSYDKVTKNLFITNFVIVSIFLSQLCILLVKYIIMRKSKKHDESSSQQY